MTLHDHLASIESVEHNQYNELDGICQLYTRYTERFVALGNSLHAARGMAVAMLTGGAIS